MISSIQPYQHIKSNTAKHLACAGFFGAFFLLVMPLVASVYTIPNFTWQIATADINGDGCNDLVLDATGGVSYLQNNGDGTFAPYEIIIPGPVVLLACCQLDNQAGADIAVFRVQGGNTVTPLQFEFYFNGDFTNPVTFPFVGDFTIGSSFNFAHGDFNADGFQDIAVAGFTHHPTNHLYWFYMYNLGNRQFSDPVWGQPAYNVVGNLRITDVNGGGCDDIVYLDSSIFILYSAGTQFITDEIYGNYHYVSIDTADFDQDGDKDLVANSWEGGWNNHHRYYETLGFGNYVLHDQMYQHHWGDMFAVKLNADNYPDLISIYGSGFAVYLNQQDWTTEFYSTYTIYYENARLYGVVGKFNNDEYDDIAIAWDIATQNNLHIRFCNGDGSFREDPVAVQDELLPEPSLQLSCYPNPFVESSTMEIDISRHGNISSEIYNLKGQLIKSWPVSAYLTGKNSLVWNATDNQGNKVASGIYLWKVQCGSEQKISKVMLIR